MFETKNILWSNCLLALIKNTTFLLIMCATLAISTASLAVKTVGLSAQVAGLSASAASAAIAHRKELASAISRAKAKARLRRFVAAIPLAGIAAVGEFERRDFLAWQEENPEGSFKQYSCEIAALSAEVLDEVLQELPELARPSPERVLSMLPECTE
ncbi:hypothetical protein KO498_00605 [Lentibacter algarum]|uniref:hypothetical protein n=1 Tax=Lentibacter algarum TaxID=576131 RepID=UPI001C06DFD0|nr:hypothetical protein [Lentibacter algarum]MBU2980299.1 hypothetical protein [Lentibacter algarum]